VKKNATKRAQKNQSYWTLASPNSSQIRNKIFQAENEQNIGNGEWPLIYSLCCEAFSIGDVLLIFQRTKLNQD
jgi:hypothetical protein